MWNFDMPEPNLMEPLRLKSYFSGTVEAAMDLARKELGDDALLVNARPSTPETRHLGKYEVVFGTVATRYLPPPLPPSTQSQPSPLAAEVAELRRRLEQMSWSLA